MITEDTISISRKFFPRLKEDSMMHIALASNEEWPVAIDKDDRRFAVFQVNERHKNRQDYFGPLLAELATGGRAVMLHELLERRITRNLKQPPNTAAKFSMKIRSFAAIERWW